MFLFCQAGGVAHHSSCNHAFLIPLPENGTPQQLSLRKLAFLLKKLGTGSIRETSLVRTHHRTVR